MYMRGIVSVLLLIPFLFCSCGRKQPPRQETPEQEQQVQQAEEKERGASVPEKKAVSGDYQEGSLKVRISAKEQQEYDQAEKTVTDNSNVVILDRKQETAEAGETDQKKKHIKKSELHRRKLWTKHTDGSLAARLASKNPDKIIRWSPKLVTAGTVGVRLPDAAVSPDRTLIVFIETTGAVNGPYGSRIIAFDTNTWTVPVLYQLPEEQIVKVAFIGDTGRIAALCKGQGEPESRDKLLVFDLQTGETVESCDLDYRPSRIVAEKVSGMLYVTEANAPDVRIYNPGNLGEAPKRIRSRGNDPAIAFADKGAKIVMASGGMLEFYKTSDFRPLSNLPVPENFTPQEILFLGGNLYLLAPPKTEMQEGICVLNTSIRRFGGNSAGVLSDSFEPDTFFALMSRKGEIAQFAIPSLEKMSSIFPEDLAPRKAGDPVKVYSVPHARCLAVLDSGGNFYLLYRDADGRKWRKELLFSAMKE